MKDKKGRKEDEEDYAISIALLADIIEELMRVFWEFIRADKDAANTSLNGLQDSADSELLMDIKTSLQKVWFLTSSPSLFPFFLNYKWILRY